MQQIAMNQRDGVRIDIARLLSSIEEMLPRDMLKPPKCCIFKIPVILSRHNKEAFIPNAFSIGPLHHGQPNLISTQKIKAKYLQDLISRSHSPDTMLITLISSIMKVEKEARECYAVAIDHYTPEELVKILVIDGCFIIELFLKKAYINFREEDDPIFSMACMLALLYYDLILLENQVPWMVLEILLDLTTIDYDDDIPLILLATNFLDINYLSFRIPPEDQLLNIEDIKHFVDLFWKLSTLSNTNPMSDQRINNKCIKHFVDLFRKLSTLSSTLFTKLSSSTNCMKSSTSSSIEDQRLRAWELLPSATSLMEAGIKFKRGSSQSILDIKFVDGVLEIPPFLIQETTETVFRNLISYEQCYSKCEDRITSYAMLLDNLINTAKDMDILSENEIIDSWLNPDDAAQLFNKLYLDTYVSRSYYIDLCQQVNSYCQRRWPRWRAVLVRNYFNTPWAIISTLAAIILLILSFLQTLYSMNK